MKISQIELFQADLPHSGGVYLLSGGRTYSSFDASIVCITCGDGTQGWGRARRSAPPTSPRTRSGSGPVSRR